jgi:hypothetical protein
MKNHVCGDHIPLQLELKNLSNITMLQLNPPKCNSYAFYKYDHLINKFHVRKLANYLVVAL